MIFSQVKNLKIIFYTLVAFLAPFLGFLFLLFTRWGKISFHNMLAHFILLAITGIVAFYTCYSAYGAYKKSRDPRVFIIALAFYTFGFIFILHALAVPGFFAFNETIFDVTEHYGLFFGSLILTALLLPFTEGGKESVFKRRFPIFLGLVAGLFGWFLVTVFSPAVAEILENAVNLFIGLTGLLFLTSFIFLLKQYFQTQSRLLFFMILGLFILVNAAIIPFFYTEWNLLWWFFHLTFFSGFAVIMAGVLKTKSTKETLQPGQDFESAFSSPPLYSKISTKLTALFVPLILLAIFTIYNNRAVIQHIDRAREHTVIETQKLILSARLDYLTVAISRTMYHSIVLLPAEINEGVMREMDEMKDQKAERRKVIQQLKDQIELESTRVSHRSGEAEINGIDELLRREDAKDSEIMDQMMMSGDASNALNSSRRIETELRPLTERLDTLIDKFIEDRKEEIGQHQAEIKAAEDSGNISLIVVAGFAVLLILFVFFLIMKLLTKPILAMTKTAQEIARGDLSSRAEVKSNDELGVLAQSFNAMTDNLLEARKLPENIIRSMVESLMVVTPEAKIKEVNQATLDLLGYEQKELLGEPIEKVFGRAAAAAAADTIFKGAGLEKLIKEGAIKDKEMTYRTKKGEEVPVSVSGSVIKDENGKMIGIVVSAKDMRVYKELENSKVAAAEKTKREFAEKMAEELEGKVKERTAELQDAVQRLQASEQQQKAANQQLNAANQQLSAAQKNLQDKLLELERFNKVAVGRELKMVELKEEIARLKDGSSK